MITKLIGILVTLIFLTVFIINNASSMPVKFLKWHADIPVIIVILVSILVGVILSLPAYFQFLSRAKKKEKYLKERVEELEQELGKKKENAKK